MPSLRFLMLASVAISISALAVAGIAAAQTASPAATQGSDLSKSGLVGTLEGPQLILDPALVPKEFHEAPVLAEQVKSGKLPPVKDRLPAEPMVIKPLHEIGKYGGTWRRAFIGPGDVENGNRISATDKLMFWDESGDKIVPAVAKSVDMAEDGKNFTVHLRKGMKWSDGAPFTADDFTFWYQDIYGNKDVVPTPMPDMSVNGKPGKLVKLDETTVQFQFDEPYFLFYDLLAGDTLIGGGQAARQTQTFSYGAYSPAHYLKQFLPKYSSEDEVNKRAKAEGYDNWVKLLHFKKDWSLNKDLPTLGPWRMTNPINTPNWVLERNPYYYEVDTAGNQLPYMDRVIFTLAQDTEVVNLRAMAGEYDLQERHIDVGKLPVILENQKKGNYTVHLDLAINGGDTIIFVNQSYVADPEIAKFLTNADFRRALSLGIDRDQINETFFLGLATPGSVVPADNSPYNPGPEWRRKWSTYEPEKANQMLDAIGLAKKDGEGYRLRTDNGERLRLQVNTARAFLPWPNQLEMVAQQWKKIGIQLDVKEVERSLMMTRMRNNEHQLMVWNNGGTELLYLFPRHAIPVDPTEAYMGPAFAVWYASNGKQGTAPTDPNILNVYDLFRSAAGQKAEERFKIAQEIWKIVVDQQWDIGTVGQSSALMGVRLVSNKLGNIASRVCIAQHCRVPGGSHPETWYYKE
jgi:peptide/nickel transport system substrate-binding protein